MIFSNVMNYLFRSDKPLEKSSVVLCSIKLLFCYECYTNGVEVEWHEIIGRMRMYDHHHSFSTNEEIISWVAKSNCCHDSFPSTNQFEEESQSVFDRKHTYLSSVETTSRDDEFENTDEALINHHRVANHRSWECENAFLINSLKATLSPFAISHLAFHRIVALDGVMHEVYEMSVRFCQSINNLFGSKLKCGTGLCRQQMIIFWSVHGTDDFIRRTLMGNWQRYDLMRIIFQAV